MRAHGNTPGPTHRPYLTGSICGLLAQVPAFLILYFSGAFESLSQGIAIVPWATSAISTVLMVVAGILYAAIFKRAANDFTGGWLFGMSYGFLLWMISPLMLWQLFTSRPVAVGTAAMGMFGTHVVFGLTLGFLFPRVHSRIQKRLNSVSDDKLAGAFSSETKMTKGI